MHAALSPEVDAEPEPGAEPAPDEGPAADRESSVEVRGRGAPREVHPPPDFRYVALEPEGRRTFVAALIAGAAGCAGATLALGHARFAGLVTAAAAFVWLGLRARRGGAARGPSLALVPWGLLVDCDVAPRALSWASVRAVRVVSAHGRDGGNTTTVASFVTVETRDETYVGRTPGEANLERLEAHLPAYTEEQARPVALDLDGLVPADVTDEGGAERLLSCARVWLDSAAAHDRLGLRAGTYRRASARAATPRAIATLASVLHDVPRDLLADPRAFAAVVAAEIGARELVPELLALVQSPHPLVAAFAKQSARRLGAPTSRVGSLAEVGPFLHADDERVLMAYCPPADSPSEEPAPSPVLAVSDL